MDEAFLSPRYDLARFHEESEELPMDCVPSCVEMIFWRRGFVPPPKQRIGFSLGLRAPAEYGPPFGVALEDTGDVDWWGTRINEPRYGLQQFFDTYGCSLKEDFVGVDEVVDVRGLLFDRVSRNVDVLVCYEASVLYALGGFGRGHASLVEGVGVDDVTLVDPSHEDRVVVSLDLLVESVFAHRVGGRFAGGFWVVE